MRWVTACLLSWCVVAGSASGQGLEPGSQPGHQPTGLEKRLLAESPAELAAAARQQGDAARGAIAFYQPYMACTKCHTAGEHGKPLGPDLARLPEKVDGAHLVESILKPSQAIRKEFQPWQVITGRGKTIVGILHKRAADELILRDAGQSGKLIRIATKDIDEAAAGKVSIMPAGLVNQLTSRQQFLDLVKYLLEVTTGGPERALALKPAPSLYAARPLPEYEQNIDHAGMIGSLDQQSYKRGEAIYNRLCINCHGTHDRPGSLPTSLRFAAGKFKSGSDPFTMYQTLTRGFGMMVPQAWMVPQQKYDVIHYIRESYLKRRNPEQYFAVNGDYLAGLPKGDTRGPAPSNIVPWQQMDYGPNLVATYEIGNEGTNFAYKGNAIRLDHGPGGVSQGRHWIVFDYDTLRVAAAWRGKGFIDWNGINFNGRHNIHPRVAGQVDLANPSGPGWANPDTGDFAEVRVIGRDKRRYGPLPRKWAHYKGMYYHGSDTIIDYTVGNARILEMPGLETVEVATAGKTARAVPVYKRTFNIAARDRDLILQVARWTPGSVIQQPKQPKLGHPHVAFGPPPADGAPAEAAAGKVEFNGGTFLQVDKAQRLRMHDADYSIFARIKTRRDGTIFCKTTSTQSKWVPDGTSLFIRGGRLTFDVGWVGAVRSNAKVADGRRHDVAMTWGRDTGTVRLYVDGKLSGQGVLKPKTKQPTFVARIGYTAADFPNTSFFLGELSDVRFFSRQLNDKEIGKLGTAAGTTNGLVASWNPTTADSKVVRNLAGKQFTARVVRGAPVAAKAASGWLAAGLAPQPAGIRWTKTAAGDLRLTIPRGNAPLRFTLWWSAVEQLGESGRVADAALLETPDRDLAPLTRGGPSRWPDKLETTATVGADKGPFAVDILNYPTNNPWFCRMRLTGFDFYSDKDRMAVCDWDGNVWLVSGLTSVAAAKDPSDGPPPKLTWRRIASGLFQPLGLKIVNDTIYVGCRDQICILHDLNGDGEIDHYENFNNDHQVTDHFHEFAMGLQRDAAGNFYYAKSARHALTALVPHHGTLLRVSKDGKRTDILANGFRAANGVCLNPDGSFIVTDQEGHWNPKNRINWVREGGFYGNMFGYHDITDSADSAMQQPLCWITNSFDRSPAELLWADSPAWGPLRGSLLNLSYGYGKVYVVPHEHVNGQMQGGMCALPIPRFPTGVMRGRFSPFDHQLYLCGMFAWAGNQTQAGGFYRLRYTGRPVHLPTGLNATQRGVRVTFSGELDRELAARPQNFAVKTWSLKRTARYGSKHYNERPLKVTNVKVGDDGRSVFLTMPDIQPTWCMEIKYSLRGADGQQVEGMIHNTIHRLGEGETRNGERGTRN